MIEIIIIALGFLSVVGILTFTYKKLPMQIENFYCLFCKEKDGPNEKIPGCIIAKEVVADFFMRRNEFWESSRQAIIILIIITVLTVLLLTDKIEAAAALPIMSGLASFGLGKGISSIKGVTNYDDAQKRQTQKPEPKNQDENSNHAVNEKK
jgi:hypothetical protein